jgi:hypothetical protein
MKKQILALLLAATFCAMRPVLAMEESSHNIVRLQKKLEKLDEDYKQVCSQIQQETECQLGGPESSSWT